MSSEKKSKKEKKDTELTEVESAGGNNNSKVDAPLGQNATRERDVLISNLFVRFFMIFVYIVGFAIFFWFLANIVRKYQSLGTSPITGFSFNDINQTSLSLPQVTVCNWNQNGNLSNPNPTTPCSNCNLTLVRCTQLFDGADCASLWNPIQWATRGGIFNCFQFNADAQNTIFARSFGYSGSYETIWSVPMTPVDPTAVEFKGLQFTVTEPNGVNPDVIYNEAQFAPVGFNSYFVFGQINTIQRQLSPENPLYNVTTFEVSAYVVNLLPPAGTPASVGLVGVSFGYQGLALQSVFYDIAYGVDQFFADFSAVFLILTGLNWVKVIGSIFTFFVAIKMRSYLLIQKHFTF